MQSTYHQCFYQSFVDVARWGEEDKRAPEYLYDNWTSKDWLTLLTQRILMEHSLLRCLKYDRPYQYPLVPKAKSQSTVIAKKTKLVVEYCQDYWSLWYCRLQIRMMTGFPTLITAMGIKKQPKHQTISVNCSLHTSVINLILMFIEVPIVWWLSLLEIAQKDLLRGIIKDIQEWSQERWVKQLILVKSKRTNKGMKQLIVKDLFEQWRN
jgi:hypothetical protein